MTRTAEVETIIFFLLSLINKSHPVGVVNGLYNDEHIKKQKDNI